MAIRDLLEIFSLLAIIVGGITATRTFIISQRQRKLENSFRLIALFKKTITKKDMNNWINIFISTSELSGAKHGYFNFNNEQIPIEYLFSEGNIYDGQSISRIADYFELVGVQYAKGTIDINLIYYEFGQIINSIHDWLSTFRGCDEKIFIEGTYPLFSKMVRKNKKNFDKWFYKTIFTIE